MQWEREPPTQETWLSCALRMQICRCIGEDCSSDGQGVTLVEEGCAVSVEHTQAQGLDTLVREALFHLHNNRQACWGASGALSFPLVCLLSTFIQQTHVNAFPCFMLLHLDIQIRGRPSGFPGGMGKMGKQVDRSGPAHGLDENLFSSHVLG